MLGVFLHFFGNVSGAALLGMLFYLLNDDLQFGKCVPMEDSFSLSYGAASGKGQVVQPMRSPTKTTQIVQSAPLTTTKTTLLEVTPIKPSVSAVSPTSITAPSKHHEPVCIEASTLGIPTVQNCRDLKIMGRAPETVVILQSGLEDCELMDDTSCDNGSGEGLRAYQARLSKAGGVAIHSNPGVGPCLTVDKKPDGYLEIKTALGWSSSILCCRPICFSTTTTTTKSTTTSTTKATMPQIIPQAAPQEALLPLEDEPTPPPYRRPSVTTAPPPFPEPFAGISAQIPIVTTVPPPQRASFGEMCVMPKFLELPRVTTCEDLRDLALSTGYVELVNIRAAECAWVDDTSCGPSYPGLGAYLEGGVPDGACLAFRQTSCGNVVGPYPILGKHLKDICRRPSPQSKNSSPAQMMPVMMMPMPAPSKGKGGRRLEAVVDESIGTLIESINDTGLRRLHGGKGGPSKGGSSSDSVVLCCRLQCSGVQRGRASAPAPTGEAMNLFQLMQPSSTSLGSPPEMRGFAANNYGGGMGGYGGAANPFGESGSGGIRSLVPNVRESELCNARYSRICVLATPLNGEQIIFDQRCMSENLSGCYVGGLQCCRSVSIWGY